MKTIKGPAVFLAQFMDDKAPFNSLDGLCQWAADLGYKGIQIPTWESRLIDFNPSGTKQSIFVMNSKAKSDPTALKSQNFPPIFKGNSSRYILPMT